MADTVEAENPPDSATQSVISVANFANYLKRAVQFHLEDGEDTPASFNTALKDASNLLLLAKFLSDAQIPVLFIERCVTKDDEEEGDEKEVFYNMHTDVHYTNNKVNSLLIMKRGLMVEADKPIATQIVLLDLPEGSPYENLHAIITNAVAPYFKSFIRSTGKADRDGDKIAPSVEKKLAEVEMGLLHLQQNIDIPEITLIIHQTVASMIKKASDENRRARVSDFGDKVEDANFLNQLQSGVNRWIREIQKVTKLDRDPSSGTALQEISFWLNLERALLRIQEKRESIDIALTLDILKHGKRFHATVSFDTDTGLKQALATVNDYNPLMKDFPLNDLLSATELDKIRQAVQLIFTHLRKIKNTKYPIQRALRLVEAISRDLLNQLLKVLGTRRLMHIAFEEYEKVTTACFEVFSSWDDEYEKLQGLLRDIIKKKRDESMKMVWRVSPAHKRLQARLEEMRKFRHQHEQLRQVIVRVLRPTTVGSNAEEEKDFKTQQKPLFVDASDANAMDEVHSAYESIKVIDCLDVTPEGTDAWEAAMKRYDERIDRVETRITARLRDQLGTAKNANEMFRIFSRFNALFVRPHIRGAIREYQTQLIQRVKDDIENLHDKFKSQYSNSKDCRMSRVRDLPPVSGSIIWARQIEHQLDAYMHRVEDVLGKGWESHVEGQKLKGDGDSFRQKLNTQALFEDWSKKVQQKQLSVTGKIFMIETIRARTANAKSILKLRINFLPEIITLSKEARNLKWLGFRVPLATVNKAHQANQLYPFAISLIENIRTYERTNEKVDERSTINLLIAGIRKEVQILISEGMSMVWESYKLDPYVQKLAEAISAYQDKVDDLLVIDEQIDVEVKALDRCPYLETAFNDILNKIQKLVDDLNLHQYSNLAMWVHRLDQEVEKRLAARLEAAIKAWTKALAGPDEDDDFDNMDTDKPSQATFRPGGNPQIKTIIHELRITNQVMYLNPSVEEAKSHVYNEFQSWISVILKLSRIQHSRYQVGFETIETDAEKTYRHLMRNLPNGMTSVQESYGSIENLINDLKEYTNQWFRYQKLWDRNPEELYNLLGEKMSNWMKTVESIKESRKTFDTSETRKNLGPIIVDFGKVQSKVTLKYDSWHKDVLTKFGQLLGTKMTDFHQNISKSRSDLELQSIETANTSDAVNLITHVQGLKRKLRVMEKDVDMFKNGQRLLERQRFQFPSNWLYIDNVEGEWSAFNDMMKRKDNSIQSQVASLQMKIVSQDKSVESQTANILGEWEREKPVEGGLTPGDAVNSLTIFEGKLLRLKEERDNLAKAKEALELTEPGIVTQSDERMSVALEELQDLKGVWSELGKIWERIDEMKDKLWLTVQPRKLRQEIDSLLNDLKDLPARLRQYASFEHVKKTLQGYAKVNVLIVELKSEAIKERHWKMLMKKLRVSWNMPELNLGLIWEANLLKNEATVKDVLLVAQGEMALEVFLKQVASVWKTYELELTPFQNKCSLIKGWDDLFNKVKEHINSLSAMKMSPYYKEFEEDALSWEDKLNRINTLFDVWIDVQRRWVYLEGIFSGSADIKVLLPVETSKFASVSTEFLALMKKVSKSPLIIDVLNITNVLRQLERLADLLCKIQKALGEYLERERSSFPRFYFVGDEDLLEIIGNSKNIGRLQKHFKKMFAGVYALLLNEDECFINGLASKEGEEVLFQPPIDLKEFPKINEWLTEVERRMRFTLASQLADAVSKVNAFKSKDIVQEDYLKWVDSYQAQLVVLAAQISWSESTEQILSKNQNIEDILLNVDATLTVLADSVLHEQPPVRRRKLEHLITELVHQRDVTRQLLIKKVDSAKSFDWLQQMRFYFDPKNKDVLKKLTIHMANAKFHYGFEYLGIQEKLVQTPLTDRCYLTMTQALEARLGGSPFGPAGTGKTESVKSLGNQLGRFVLVFNCDETFDFQAMGRIFIGLCQVGAWGCFDEFNRLEERMLSACSQQIQTIQEALKENLGKGNDDDIKKSISIELIGKQVKVSSDMAIFITMNPGYAGRSNLPDNLKKLFRSLAMTQPDRQLIAQVMLYSQGFRSAETLSNKIVPFFKLCDEQLSPQSHYDFGLRALKSVLISAGNVKRERIARVKLESSTDNLDDVLVADRLNEQEILIQSVMETMVPKLVAEDIPLLNSLLSDVFPGVKYNPADMKGLKTEIQNVCKSMHLIYGENDEIGSTWVEKVLQLYQITQLHHGLMMVGPSGSGKSTAWRVLLQALQKYEGVEGVSHVIDPKSISKDFLYGNLDQTTREWTDGLFTHILRKIIDNVRGEIGKRQWIIFDGDVDPEWVENLNSVLDDNKLLTLPNGERLSIPPNVRIMFEVQDLRYATLATVSRCGMVWFSEDVLKTEMIFDNFLTRLRNVPVDESEEEIRQLAGADDDVSENMKIQRQCAIIFTPFFSTDGIVVKCLHYAADLEHVMDFTRLRVLNSLFSLLNQSVRNVLNYNSSHSDFPLPSDDLERYISKSLIYAVLWSFSGDGKLKIRQQLGDFIRSVTTIELPPAQHDIIDYEIILPTGNWQQWATRVPKIEVETHKVGAPDVVVPTVDTVRHESLLYTWLAEHKPIVLCGPPGSGKTMTLFSALRALPELEVVGLNFSSATTPELMLKTFDHYCEYRKTPNGLILSPMQMNKWLVLFCDEINLPDMDKYGTQRIISFLRQMVEHGGFYNSSDQTWVKFERIQFVGACNPPTDPGRKPLSHRFLRHVPVVYVDYPGKLSLMQIYGTFNRAMLRLVPVLRSFADPLTLAMVELYAVCQERFTQDMQPHYIYSPREMTRWVRGICEALKPLETLSAEGLVRLWAHEALRLFHDRLVTHEERSWMIEQIDAVAVQFFPNFDKKQALVKPILYSNWLSKDYIPVDQEELREYVKARLKVFYEEELDVPLVLFNEVLDHVLRIDRIFKQPQGHLLLIGVSGAGKTTLSRFVAWMNGLTVFQVKVHNKYTAADFDEDLRNVLRRSGTKGEKICFIMDESNVLDSSFLERMNTLLANGEVPGLFEGDELTTLMTQCKEGSQRDGKMLDSHEELYKWFTHQVMYNLHVVFTMNPSSEGLKDRAATSPALFNRCVLNWFGDWSTGALFQVGKEFTIKIDLENTKYVAPDYLPFLCDNIPQTPSHRDIVVNSFVFVHQTMHRVNERMIKRGCRTMAITPRHFLDFINHYVKLTKEKRSDLEEQQLHLNVGLAKIRDTVKQVEDLQTSLSSKSIELENKNQAANAKLKQMLKDQQEAERKKVTSQELELALQKQTTIISEKQSAVKADLAQVEPAVLDAQQAVKGIKKQNLVELRGFANPPALVKVAMESIMTLLGEDEIDWKSIRSTVMRENFISTIVNFNTDFITEEIRQKMKTKFLSNPDYNFEKMNRASAACGPMVKWAIAQINFSDMLNRIEPLRNELKSLEGAADENRKKANEVKQLITDLEKSIGKYKEEYALLIADAQAIKADLVSVQTKVDRSVALLTSLSSEKERWEAGSETFKSQMSTIVGDVLLSSAFMAYAGYYDQHMRESLFHTWVGHLQQANIQFRSDLAKIEYLSNADDRLKWQANSLPSDDLCTENAIMLNRFNRYPLIIDPSGQATEFIMNCYKDRKITKTSFLDDSFKKHLESALRFGNPLLVQDVENYDSILNPVLNRELRKTGGRVLITIGDQDIDLSPSFTIFLSCRDPTVEFRPDICSRVTFVNFTVTRHSLQSQCLNTVLKAERPDVDEKRSDLLKLQGEFRLRLRQLEKSLLSALNEVKGRILDDDSIISHLETLKKEAGEIARKVEETDVIMAEVETVSAQYIPLAQSCSSIYFTLESLNQIHFLYQYSLHFFFDIFQAVLDSPRIKDGAVKEYDKRLKIITDDLFRITYERVARGMLHVDRIDLAILLARIHLKQSATIEYMDNEEKISETTYEKEWQHFLRGAEAIIDQKKARQINGLTAIQSEATAKLAKIDSFKDVNAILTTNKDVPAWLETITPEKCVPCLWSNDDKLSPIGRSIHQLLTIQALRPDRLLAATHMFVDSVLGDGFMIAADLELNLADIVEKDIKASTPVLLCSVTGYDASGRVDDLAAELNKQLTSIAIGSAEGFSLADRAISSASKSGRWVLLKNVHLAPQWLFQLEKRLHSLTPHANFRLFLTMEINSKLPVNLLRSGRIFVFEPPPGVKASLLRTFSSLSANRMGKPPFERARLYFLLAWLHAIVGERLRYAPLGWSKKYEFNESDLKCASDTIDTWLDSVAMNRTNLPPEKIPWDALRTLLAQCIYGGKIDNEFDQRLLNTFLNNTFTAETFTSEYSLVTDVDGIKGKSISMPEALKREQFVQWVENLPAQQTPSWLGLPNNAENVLLTNRAMVMVGHLLKMQVLEDDDDLVYSGGDNKKEVVVDARPAWIRTLHTSIQTWAKLVPKTITPMKRTAENIKDPLFRFFEREVKSGFNLLTDVRRDINEVALVCEGEKKPTNHHRELMVDLAKGQIPKAWLRYTVPPGLTVIQWITDFAERAQQLSKVSEACLAGSLKRFNVWLGGLFIPEAYITATRQYVAQANEWSLEELRLKVNVIEKTEGVPAADAFTFSITGLTTMGAKCLGGSLQLSSSISTIMPLTRLTWERVGKNVKPSSNLVTLPVYLNATRSQILFTVDLESTSGFGFYERGVAIISSILGS